MLTHVLIFLLKPFVRRVKRRFCIRRVRFQRSMKDVEACFSSGSPKATRFSIVSMRPGEYLLAALFGLTPESGLLLANVLMISAWSISPGRNTFTTASTYCGETIG